MILYGLHDGNPDDVRYVGVTTRALEERLKGHLKESQRDANTYKRRWIQKAMAEGHKIGIVALDHAESKADLMRLEQFWIMVLGALGARLTNATAGGDGLLNPSPETRAKMSKAHTNLSPDTLAKLSKGHLAWWANVSPEERRAWGLKVSGHTDDERSARSQKMLAARYAGHVNRTPKEKREIRNAANRARYAKQSVLLGRERRSEETKEKMSSAQLARWSDLPTPTREARTRALSTSRWGTQPLAGTHRDV